MRLCFVTGSRADYGLLELLILECMCAPGMDVKILVTGSHAYDKFGKTADYLVQVDWDIPCLMQTDFPEDTCKSIGIIMLEIGRGYRDLSPDAIVILGDRYEMLAAAMAARIMQIPIIHIEGGELTYGAYDDGFRHAITKLSSLHLVATERAKQRVIQLGEPSGTVRNVGALGCYGLEPVYQKEDLFVIVWHPVTLGDEDVLEVIKAMEERPEYKVFILPNQDNGGGMIRRQINKFVAKNRDASTEASLPRREYLRLLGRAKAIIGNSSSGIIEAPSLHTPTVNIGSRQAGREQATSIFNCECEHESIIQAIEAAVIWQEAGSVPVTNPYAGMDTVISMVDEIKQVLPGINIVKQFYDIIGNKR